MIDKGEFIGENERRVSPGDKVQYQYEPRSPATVICVFQNEEAEIQFENGQILMVKWESLVKFS